MIEKVFLLKLAASFLVAGGYLVSIVAISERVSPKVGGIIAGIPSTVLIATMFITWTERPYVAKTALILIPAMVVVSLTLVAVFLFFPRDNLLTRIVAAGLMWLAIAWLARYALSGINFWTSFAVSLVGCLGFGYLFNRWFKDGRKAAVPAGRLVHVIRFITAGTVVALAVLFARVLDPFWGGIMSAFPGLFAVSLYFLARSHGVEFAKAFAKQLPISILGTVFYVVSLYLLITKIQAALAILISVLVSAAYAAALLAASRLGVTRAKF